VEVFGKQSLVELSSFLQEATAAIINNKAIAGMYRITIFVPDRFECKNVALSWQTTCKYIYVTAEPFAKVRCRDNTGAKNVK
jgi:hypothetical protein